MKDYLEVVLSPLRCHSMQEIDTVVSWNWHCFIMITHLLIPHAWFRDSWLNMPYFPNMSPCDFWLTMMVKMLLKGVRFCGNENPMGAEHILSITGYLPVTVTLSCHEKVYACTWRHHPYPHQRPFFAPSLISAGKIQAWYYLSKPDMFSFSYLKNKVNYCCYIVL